MKSYSRHLNYFLTQHMQSKSCCLPVSSLISIISIIILFIYFFVINLFFILSTAGVYKAAEARLLLLMYQVNYVNQGNQLKDSAIAPAKIIEDSWTMDGFVSLT